jgi:hypothetical protein
MFLIVLYLQLSGKTRELWQHEMTRAKTGEGLALFRNGARKAPVLPIERAVSQLLHPYYESLRQMYREPSHVAAYRQLLAMGSRPLVETGAQLTAAAVEWGVCVSSKPTRTQAVLIRTRDLLVRQAERAEKSMEHLVLGSLSLKLFLKSLMSLSLRLYLHRPAKYTALGDLLALSLRGNKQVDEHGDLIRQGRPVVVGDTDGGRHDGRMMSAVAGFGSRKCTDVARHKGFNIVMDELRFPAEARAELEYNSDDGF